ncbi:hypothetical protein LK09_02720 [Microbacterium mangrovi]|uniref:Uncharacterized protein n=1 Tax=Microbacterium mangrovi TaxID=1348253 RepID=A0A0B2AD95_9MICO|nr:tetratricopeptide repeat protein [Microbacterium mangrovi]KHK99552.1 hypothetical protein LK09_02720 [Microbacterium mangrovi]
MSTIRGYDPETLREIVDQRECRERLEALGEQRSLPALLERVWLLKVLGDLDASLSYAELAVRQSRMAGTRKDLLRSRVLHATVLQARGSHTAAIAELDTCADEAEGQNWPNVAAFALQHRGKVYYDLGQFEEARADFKRALFLRQQAGAPEEALQTTLQAVDAAERRRADVAVSA